MADLVTIPMFPLSIFPLPGEMVPLHIFEPRYRQLLSDSETNDLSFGIYFNHPDNTNKFGSLVKLESILKRYPTGESDIIVRCIDLFKLESLARTLGDKLYPGGEVHFHHVQFNQIMDDKLINRFAEYLQFVKRGDLPNKVSIYDVAHEFSLDFPTKLKLVSLDSSHKESFLLNQLTYHLHLLQQVEKAKDVFHLN
jgi:uncharacterized protein